MISSQSRMNCVPDGNPLRRLRRGAAGQILLASPRRVMSSTGTRRRSFNCLRALALTMVTGPIAEGSDFRSVRREPGKFCRLRGQCLRAKAPDESCCSIVRAKSPVPSPKLLPMAASGDSRRPGSGPLLPAAAASRKALSVVTAAWSVLPIAPARAQMRAALGGNQRVNFHRR